MQAALLSAVGTVGFAVAVGQILARRLRVPAILLYLLVGILAGPSVLGLVDAHVIGKPFEVALELLVAMIVFEGAFSIDLVYLRRVGRVVRNLLTIGLVLTFAAGALLVGATGLLPWHAAVLFGALVTVTGPTVITPLVRSVRLNDHVRAVLLGEAVLIDPLGAVVVVVALEFVLSGVQPVPLLWAASRLGGGAALGLAGVGAVRVVLWLNRGSSSRESALLLFGMSIGVFALAERLLPNSGLSAMVVMGVGLAAAGVPHAESVRAFEDDLSRLMIAAVYVLAAASVDVHALRVLWPGGVLVVLALMVLVRPAVALACAFRSDLTWRERAYVGLMGPRGVVAAALAALAGERLGEAAGGHALTALVFLTIALTVAVQSTYAGWLARVLEVRAMKAVIAGSGRLARQLATHLAGGGFDVTLIDPFPDSVERARAAGLDAQLGDATSVHFLRSVEANRAQIAVGATDSDQANLLFCQYVRAENPEAQTFARVHQADAAEAFRNAGIHAVSEADAVAQAFMDVIGTPVLHDALSAGGERLSLEVPVGSGLAGRAVRQLGLPERVLVLLVRRGDQEVIPHGNTVLQRGDRLLLWGTTEAVMRARAALVSIE